MHIMQKSKLEIVINIRIIDIVVQIKARKDLNIREQLNFIGR